jgi:phosphoglycolate phosphatase-like HAD superfamily hydrolase
VRSGWQQVMAGMMLDELAAHGVTRDSTLAARVAQAIADTTGRPTVEQMAWLATEVARHGGAAAHPEAYKARYLAALGETVAGRLAQLQRGELADDALLVPGSRVLLQRLRAAGVRLALVSGTDREAVVAEATALGIAGMFDLGIFAPSHAMAGFAKQDVMAALLAQEGVPGAALLAIGDGPVEIAAARALGGVAVGVAFDEERGAGLDAARRALLIAAGADVIVEDLRGLLDEQSVV